MTNPMQAISDVSRVMTLEPVVVRELTAEELAEAQKKFDALPNYTMRLDGWEWVRGVVRW